MRKRILASSLFQPNTKKILSLVLAKQGEQGKEEGILYTVCNCSEGVLGIGYASSLDELNSLNRNYNCNIVAKRYGMKREFNLVKMALNESGFKELSDKSFYYISEKLTNILKALQWPVESSRSHLKRYRVTLKT